MLLAASLAEAQVATWNGAAADGLWNTAGNWDIGVPAEGTNAVIGAGATVNYTAPMATTKFGTLNNSGTLNVSAGGFNLDGAGATAYTAGAAGILNITSNGVMVVSNSGGWNINLAGPVVDVEGGTLIVTNSTSSLIFGLNGNNAGIGFTNNGGTVIFSQPFQSKGRFTRVVLNGGTTDFQGGAAITESSNDQERQFLINGGTVNLGNFSVSRALEGVGAAGLVISNGVVNATSIQIGNTASRAGSTIFGGVLTNTGAFTICDRNNGATSGNRVVKFYIRGGTVVSTGPAGIILANQSNTGAAAASVIGATLDMNAGSLYAEGITLVKDNTLTYAYATLNLSGTGAIYLGGLGLTGNVGPANTSYAVNFSGGTIAAQADCAINANLTIAGLGCYFQAANAGGAPFNLTVNGVISGSGVLNKTGAGQLILNAANTCSGNTVISNGSLVLGAAGSLASSSQIVLSSNTVFDVSAVGGYLLNDSRTLAGYGQVNGGVVLAANSIINPGIDGAGVLTFANDLVATNGGAFLHFDLSSNPAGTSNDFVNVLGNLTLANTNNLDISGTLAAGSVYPLIHYGGTLNGSVANLKPLNPTHILSNSIATKTIYLKVQGSSRGPGNVVWTGSTTNNDWDTLTHSNWLVGGVSDTFVSGDNARFDATGAGHPLVQLVEPVTPASVAVDAASNYTFLGAGRIGGTASLTKTNSGTLTILATNSYSGVTTLAGGVVEASTLANAAANSSLGVGSPDSATLVFAGGTLRYLGDTVSSDRGATLNLPGGAVDVSNAATALTVSGPLTGGGSLTKIGAGALALGSANSYTGGTVISNGTLQLSAASSLGSGGLTNQGGATALRLNTGFSVTNVVEFNGNLTLDLNNPSTDAALLGAWSGNGTVLVTNFQNSARTLTIGGSGAGGGSLSAFTGTINMGNSTSFLRFNDGGGNQSLGSTGAVFDLGTGSVIMLARNGGVTIDLGALRGGPGTQVQGRASGASGVLTYSIGALNLDTTYEGVIADKNNATAIIKVGTGKLTLTGTNTYTGATTVNAGTLEVSGSLGATAVTVNSGAILTGPGSLAGDVTITSGGKFIPNANNTTPMSMTATLVMQPGSTNRFYINNSDHVNDSVSNLVSVTYGGTLELSIAFGPLVNGQSFQLFGAASYGGTFDQIIPAVPGPGLAWDTNNLAINGTIAVTNSGVATPPTISGVVKSGSSVIISGSGGPTTGNYYVLASTNVALPLTSWSAIATNAFNPDGTFYYTNTITPGTPRQFFRLQLE